MGSSASSSTLSGKIAILVDLIESEKSSEEKELRQLRTISEDIENRYYDFNFNY